MSTTCERLLQCFGFAALALPAACSGDGRSGELDQKHWWPHCHGHVGAYTHTNLTGPPSLQESLAWTWHEPGYEVMVGSVIDYDRNIYVTNTDGIRKFSPSGQLLWHYKPASEVAKNPSLMGEAIYGDTMAGDMFAVDIHTGKPVWVTKAFVGLTEKECGYVEAHAGMVLSVFDRQVVRERPGNVRIVALNATDGSRLWEYLSDAILWNFKASFLNDGTFLAYDVHGAARRIRMSDGSLVWHSKLPPLSFAADLMASFSDGGLTVLPDGTVAYTCANVFSGEKGTAGVLRAFGVVDGALLWQQVLPLPCVSWPAVDPTGASVVVVLGSFQQAWVPLPVGAMKFDAQTGGSLWNFFDMPALFGPGAKGEVEHLEQRIANKENDRDACGPASWGAPIIDGNGTMYASNQVGDMWAVNDFNQDGFIDKNEYDRMVVSAASLHCGAGFAPGMMVYASCDTLYVFKY